ncbi:hypothetical protein, partial [Alistipes ihumii]|uniref:hypothetical protein n=1 Tax=Alistipes ihumii TaxID=1470347 RepID=UPI003AB8E538
MADSVRQMLCPGCAAGGLPPAESVGPAEEAGICGESLHVANCGLFFAKGRLVPAQRGCEL